MLLPGMRRGDGQVSVRGVFQQEVPGWLPVKSDNACDFVGDTAS